MATIYLSSTYEDLKDYRRVVFEALRKAGYTVIGMEEYVATDQRPVDKCLQDVEKADIYVGMFVIGLSRRRPSRFLTRHRKAATPGASVRDRGK